MSAFCSFACWRKETGLDGAYLGERAGHGCQRRVATCPCTELAAARAALPSSSSRHTITHVVIAAARFTEAAAVRPTIARQSRARQAFLPAAASALVVVDNGSPTAAADELRSVCGEPEDCGSWYNHTCGRSCHYLRNGDWEAGFGYELGAWRWAVQRELPRWPNLAADALVYLLQDSTMLARPALPFPPPPSFRAGMACLVSYRPEGSGRGNRIGLLGVPSNESAALEARAIRTALSSLTPATVATSAMTATSPRYMSCFGPNVVVTWRVAQRLVSRGFFDMLRVRSKRDEQLSERAIGFFLTHDDEVRQPCSVAGDVTSHITRCASRKSCHLGPFEKHFLGRED